MKKLVVTLLATGLLLGLGSALGQAANHEVEIRIPEAMFIRITDGSSNAAVTTAAVSFDFVTVAADVDEYLDMVNAGGGDLAPTSVTDFGDVIVLSNRSWIVNVSAVAAGGGDFDFVADVVAGLTGAGVALSDIKIDPSGTPGTGVTSVDPDWDLSGSGNPIANGVRTQGWSSLGFSGDDYRLAVNGDEDPGTYTTIVTYTITTP